MKIKKSVFMLMVMLMGTFTQLVTSVTTIQAFAEGNNQESQVITNQERSPDGGNPDNNTIAPTKESSTEESQKEIDSTEKDQIEEKTEEATADQIEEPDSEKPEAQELESPEKEVRAGGRDITTMEKSGLLPRDKQGKPTILTESSMTLNGNPITEVNPLSIGDEFQIHYTFRIPDEFGKTMADGDYFEFKLPDSDIINLTRRQEGDLIDPDNGMIYGRYIGETNGNVKMIFNDKVSENDDVDGNLMFSMKLDEKSITIPGEYEIEIPGVINDESEIIIVAGKIKSYIQKEYIGDEGLKHKWKVLINPNYLKINDFELKEKTTKGKNGPNIADSINIDKMVKAKVDLQGNITEGAQVPIANKTFDSSGNIDLGFNSIEEPYVVYLNTPVPFGTKANIYNTATLIGNVGNHYLHEEASAETNAGIDLITKEAGSYNKKDQTVDWTITYNPKGIHIDQEHAYFKDIITNGTLMEETMTVAPDLKHDVTVSNDKKEFDFVFKTDVDEPVIIKYKTKVINDKEKFVVNKVITAGQEKQVSKDISTGGEGEGGDGEDGDGVSSIVKSKPIDYQGGAQWELNINKEKQKVDKWWVTDKVDSGTIRESSFELKNLTKGGNVSKADYDLEWHDSENGKAKGFTVKYNKETSDHFKITYVTDYERNTNQTNNASYHYFVKGTEKEDEDSQTYIPKVTPEIGLAKSGRFIPEDNEIEWTVLINEKKNVAIGPNNKMTDPIMSDQEYVANSAKVYYQYGVQWEDYSFAKVNFNDSKNQLEVTDFMESAYAQKVVFRTKLKNPLDIVSKTIKNTAYYQDKYTPEKNVTVTLEKDIGNEIFVKKQGKENPTNPNLIDWQVDVNPHGYHLRDLEIFDESWENQIVIRESIQLKNSIGTRLLEGIDYTLDYTERYFHIKMLDDVHEKLDLTYQGRIVFPNGTIPGSTQQVKNSIRITAKGVYTTEKPIDVKIPVKVPDSSGTIQGRTRNLNVKKVSEENPNQRLSGAEFVLYRGKDKEPGKVVNRVTTDGSGNALFDKLTKGDYLLVETKAPAGFAISNEMKNGRVVTINDNETTTVEEVVSDPKENGEKLIDIPVEKKWKDVPSGITTPEVKVRLFADGDEVDSMMLNKGNDYKGSFKNLPEKKNGKEITYTVREDDIPNYDSQVTGTTITNTYNNTEKTSISGEKIWKDDNNSANKRPDKVTVELLQDGNYYDKKEVYGSENWKYEFKNLPKVNNKTGKDYAYTVREKNIPGDYDSEVNGFNITNTFVKTEEDKIRINGEKKWLDNNNKVGVRPDFVKVTLFQGEKEYATTEAKAINNWKYEFSNLPKKDDNGKDYVYRVEEGDIPEGYESEVDGYTITNRYTKEEVVSFSGEKKWEGDKSENRPKSVKVQLYQDDKPYKEQVTNESKNWKYEFNDLPKYDSKGYLFRYRVEEVDVPDGYYSNVDGNNIINTYSVKETTEFKGEKLWKDNNNSLKTRPDYIIVYLFQNDDYKPFDTKVVSPVGNRWEYKFTNLPKYDDNNKLYRYSVKEEEVGGYQTSNTGSNDLTNTYQNKEKTSISGKKEWEDNGNQDKTRPSSITVHLLRNDKRVDKQTVTATNDWKYTFSNLDKYDENLNAYRYTVEEEEVPGYTSEVVGTTIKNTSVENELIDINGEKTWKGDENSPNARPNGVWINLMQNGVKIQDKYIRGDRDGKWFYSFEGLPLRDSSGKEYKYTVKENGVPTGYVSRVTGYNILNTYDSSSVVNIAGEKHWVDMNGKVKPRPDSLTIELQRRSKSQNFWLPVSYKTITSPTWKYEFNNQPKYDNDGNLYEYRVTENNLPPGYKTETIGNDIVNTLLKFPTIEVKATKKWDDNNNEANLRPKSITVYLLQDGKVIETKEMDINSETEDPSEWEVVFDGLYQYDKVTGRKFEYTVKEEVVPNYEVTYPKKESDPYNLEINNKLVPSEKLDIKGEKLWNDNENAFSKRPDTISVDLYQDDKKIESTEAKKSTGWKYEFLNLPKYSDNGKIYEYRVEEGKEVPGYESEVLGFDITNTYQNNEVVEVSGKKVWDDYDNKFKTRPDFITVKLYQDGKQIQKQKVDKENDWTYHFKELKKYDDNGKLYEYRVEEEDVPLGYTSIVDGQIITNTYRNNETTKIAGEKLWYDNNNQFGKRPESIFVILEKDGKEYQRKEVKPDKNDNWFYEFDELQKYDETGKEIKYTVKEEPVENYESQVVGTTISNTFINNETTKISVVKKWTEKRPDENRPEKVKVLLLKDGKEAGSEYLSEANNWSHTFDGLEKYDDNGDLFRYQVVEEGIPNYVTTYKEEPELVTITNAYDILTEKTSISGIKIWDDYNNEFKYRGDKVTIGLYQGKNQEEVLDANGKHVTTEAKADDWTYKFEGLQKYDEDKNLIEYSVKELDVNPNYVSSVQGTNIINKYTNTDTVNIDGHKVWNDYNNKFETRPDEIIVHLLQDGKKKETKTVKKDSDDPEKSYRFEFNELPKYDEHGKPYKYEVIEEVDGSYTWKSKIKETEENHYEVTLTNTYKNTEKIDLSGEKKWDDYENEFKTRPSEVTVALYKTVNGKEEIVDSKVVQENPITKKWTYEFTDLDKYDKEGNEILYEIKEITFKDEKNEYTPEFVGNDVINHYVNSETVKFKGEKKWDDYGNKFETRPKEVTIYLLRNNKKIDETKTDESKNWKYDFGKEYPVYDTKGKAYTYRVLEKDVQGYTTTIDKSADSTNTVEDYTIKNTYVNTETTKVEGNKTWDDFDGKVGDRPAKLTVTLFRGLNAETATSTGETKVLSEKNNWSYVFEDLPVYDADGNKYVYVVKEEKLDEYDQTSSGPYFVNRPKKLDELTFVKGEKSWSDENNILNKRPDKIKVILYQNEKPMVDSDGKIMTQETSVLELWKYEFINLPKYDSQGDEYQYSVKEEEVKDYESVVTGNNIENKYQNNETIDLKGNKTWDDAGNKLESRPESIQVELYQNGGDVPYQVEEVKPDDAGNWNYEFNDLPKHDEVLKEYKYTIKEVNVPHYDSSINGMNIKNSYRNDDTTEFEGKKVWFDKGNLLNKRPDDITVKLFQNGGDDPFKTQKVTPDEQGNWTYKFTDLPKYDDSLNPFKYTVEEDVVEGYESSISEVNGTTITNTLVNNEKTSFKVLKKWEDHNNILDTRPSSIRLNLYRNNGKIPYRTQKVIPDASGNWHYEFKDLPKHDNNLVEYSYSVKEMRVSDYTATVEQTTNQSAVITNEYQNNQTTEIHGDKAWINDADDKLSTRPTSIFVDLYRSDSEDDVYQTQEVVPDEDGDWSYSFKDLPKYDEDLILYTYAVKERNVDGYLGVVEGTDIINTYQNTALTKVVGEKKWADLNNKLEKRPDEISVDLYQNDIKKQTQIVKADKDGNWKYEFNDLPKYEDGTLDEYVYTVKEQKVDGYQTEIDGTTITNYYHNDEKTEVNGKKVWLDKDDKLNTRPSVIEVELYQNDGKKPFRTQFVKSNGTNEWTYQFINLPKYDEKLEEYNYTVKERKVSNYSSAIEGTTITNTYKNNQVIGVKGEKTWEDKDNKLNVRPEYIYIDLYQNDSQSPYATEKVEADDKGHWEYEFVNLPKYDDNYDEYTYQVSERKVPHYDTNQTDFNFTNTYRNDDKVEVNGEKKWDDFDNKLKKRPKRIKVDLYQNDSKTPIATKNVKANVDGDWKYSFKDLPKYDENYDEYIYTVKEQDVTNYDSKVEGTTITNTYQNKDKTDISGEKIWRDVDNKLGVRPDSIIVYLHQNGDETPMAEQKVTAGADNKWSYSFKDLPKYDANLDEYHYTVSEKEVPHYDTTIEGTTVTNDYRNDDKTKVTGKKVWNDEDNKLNLRPKSIKVELYQNDSKKPMATQTVKAGKDGNWAYSFNNLPKYDDELNEYVYTVKEQEVSHYESHIEGTTITNTYINDQKTELSGEKKWDDKDNKLKVRPMSIQVELYQNDGKKAFKTQTVTPDKDGHWNYTFKDLPKHDKELNEYVYTVKEKEVAHYDSKIDGNNITNTYRNDDTTEVAGEKKWIDEDNKINSRPTSIQVELYQNDGKEAFKKQKVTPDKNGNWSYVFKDLPKYDDNYDKYTYTVKEQKVPNYDSSVKGTTITNTYENKELIDINGEKQWNDEENKLLKRPESITVDLYRNDSKEPVDTQKVKAGEDGQWKYTFKDLPKYDDKLNEYQYTVKERKVDDYSTVIEGTTIINTYKNVKTTEVTGEKKWNDFDNKLKVRPKVIKVDLYQNNGEKPFRTQEVMPDKNGHWKYSFKALPKYDEKLNEYVYTVKEQPVKGYESKVEGTTITNTYQNKDITSIKGKKLWEDNNNKAGLRPESIMVEVYQNDSKVAFETEKVTPDASGNWNFTFKDLPKYDKELNEYKYTLKEVAVKNYTSKVDGTTITNTLTKKIDPGKKIKPGTKTGPTSKTGGQRYLPKTGEVQDNPVLTLLLGMSLISFAGAGVFFRRKY